MNIIYGLYSPDGGDIYVDGQVADISDPRDAIERRIGMVHQHFMLIPVFTVLENIILGEEDTRGPVLNLRAARQRVMALAQQYSLDVDPDSRVEDLPVGVQQRVEILKALYRRADVLVFDEPTAVLTPQETEHLFEVMRQLKRGGVSIIFITHKLKEVLAVADRITVMRDGKVIGTTNPAESNEGELAEMMVGRTVLQDARKKAMKPGAAVLQVEDLRVANNRDLVAVDGLSFEVHEREVLGIAGVQGNGQTELAEAITGLRAPLSGSIQLNGEALNGASPRQIRELGVAHVPEDRQRDGLVNRFPVEDNLVLTSYYKKPFSYNAVLQENVIEKRAAQLMADFDIRAAGLDTRVEALSGGNQQKVIIAREFSHPIRLLVAAQPTRGLDVGAIEYVHKRLLEKRSEGCAVLLISTELDEILALSDRILVMYRGQAVATLAAAEASKEQLGLLMAGVTT
jgi:simple sugar transport system ATP-binding protein